MVWPFPQRSQVDVDDIIRSAGTIMIDGKEQQILVCPHQLTSDEIKLLRAKWAELHKGIAS
jgi:hypothetical protein